MVNECRKIRSKKFREHQYIEEYDRYLNSKKRGWYQDRNVQQMWEEVKWPMEPSTRDWGREEPR